MGFTQSAQEFTRQDYLHEVEHMRARERRLDQAIVEAVKLASPYNKSSTICRHFVASQISRL